MPVSSLELTAGGMTGTQAGEHDCPSGASPPLPINRRKGTEDGNQEAGIPAEVCIQAKSQIATHPRVHLLRSCYRTACSIMSWAHWKAEQRCHKEERPHHHAKHGSERATTKIVCQLPMLRPNIIRTVLIIHYLRTSRGSGPTRCTPHSAP
jgi:hypothetical protein